RDSSNVSSKILVRSRLFFLNLLPTSRYWRLNGFKTRPSLSPSLPSVIDTRVSLSTHAVTRTFALSPARYKSNGTFSPLNLIPHSRCKICTLFSSLLSASIGCQVAPLSAEYSTYTPTACPRGLPSSLRDKQGRKRLRRATYFAEPNSKSKLYGWSI